jgi:lipid II:glycine glycyltransferase (peptidoglycan interpeptide bridge formation enzyme)
LRQDHALLRLWHIWVAGRPQVARWARSPDRSPTSAADAEWDAFVAGHPNGHILQTSAWAGLKAAFGWTADRVILRALPSPDAIITGGASILFRRLPWGQPLAYVPKGPVVDWDDPAQVRTVLTIARRLTCKHHAALLKIEPELPASPELADRLTGFGFRPSPQRIQPLSTIHIDLTADEGTILARMKPKWRYNVRLAERKGVTVREGTTADLPMIQQLLEVTGKRDAFGVHSAGYHRKAIELFASRGQMAWLLAEHEGELLAAIAVFALGCRAWYFWGASADSGRNLMPNHALQWAGLRWARSRGCAIYDLWGIPDEVGANPAAYSEPESWGEGGLWGVYRFKQGFGGQVVRYIGAWDLPVSGIGYWLYGLALRLRERESE